MARSFKKSVAVATGLGLVRMAERTASTSGYLHRHLTHRSMEIYEPLRTAARVSVWQTGIKARRWAGVHRVHHDKADMEGDPHSPRLRGKLAVLFKNKSFYSEEERRQTDDVLPPDLQPDRADKLVYDRRNIGIATGIAIDAAMNKAAGNRLIYTPITTLVGLGGYVLAGGLVNMAGHFGRRPLKAALGGEIEPHPDGTFGSDSRIVALITGGEGFQRYHHEHESDISFMPPETGALERAIFDPIGSAALALTHTRFADVGPGRSDIHKAA